jgi:uncharacterized protein YycO
MTAALLLLSLLPSADVSILFVHVVRRGQQAPWDHVAIRFSDGATYQAVPIRGVIRTGWRSGHVEVMVSVPDEPTLRLWCESQVGRHYDFRGAARAALGREPRASGRWYCSSLVAAALGLPAMRPQQLWEALR